jgi:hypothetical protein
MFGLDDEYEQWLKEQRKKKRMKMGRPDKDGYLTLEEAMHWYAYGKGQPLTVDIHKIGINFQLIYPGLFEGRRTKALNILTLGAPIKQFIVYGRVTFVYLGNYEVEIENDIYDFNYENWFNPIYLPRNIETVCAEDYYKLNYPDVEGTPYKINFKGKATISKSRYSNLSDPAIIYYQGP